MKARTRQKMIMAALPAAMIWGAYNLLWTEEKPLSSQPEVADQVVVTTESPASVPGAPDLERIKESNWGSDPFRTAIKKQGKPADKRRKDLRLILSGIVFSERSPMAVINKKSVRPGDAVGNARVVSIDRKTVTMERNGKRFLLKVTKGKT